MGKNVMIPRFLLDRIIALLGNLEPPEYHESRFDYCEIMWALELKKQKLGLMGAYAELISVYGEEIRAAIRDDRLRPDEDSSTVLYDDLPF